jgi:hypothetical protein
MVIHACMDSGPKQRTAGGARSYISEGAESGDIELRNAAHKGSNAVSFAKPYQCNVVSASAVRVTGDGLVGDIHAAASWKGLKIFAGHFPAEECTARLLLRQIRR